MKKLQVALMFVASTAIPSFATADNVMSSGPVFSFYQDALVCMVTNIQGSTVRSVKIRIIDSKKKVVALQDCGNLVLNDLCFTQWNTPEGIPHQCTVTTIDPGTNLRGNFELRDLSGVHFTVTVPVR